MKSYILCNGAGPAGIPGRRSAADAPSQAAAATRGWRARLCLVCHRAHIPSSSAPRFVTEFVRSGKPVGVICHGAWTLVEAGVLQGRTLTSWPALQTDIRNAGATWVDEQVVEDGNLVSSRKPDDIPAFNGTLIAKIAAV